MYLIFENTKQPKNTVNPLQGGGGEDNEAGWVHRAITALFPFPEFHPTLSFYKSNSHLSIDYY